MRINSKPWESLNVNVTLFLVFSFDVCLFVLSYNANKMYFMVIQKLAWYYF